MSQHQLHTGQTTISDIPHNDSVHNLLEGEGATVYGNSAATSKLNIFGKGKALSSWATAKAKGCIRDVHAALVVAAIVAIIDTIKATGGRLSKLCLRGNERVERGDALSTLHNDGAYQAWFVNHRHKAVGAGNGSSLRIIGIFYPAPGMPVCPSAEMTITLASLFSSTPGSPPPPPSNGLPGYMATATPDQLSANATKAWETQEELGNGLPAYMATATPEQRSERSRKGRETQIELGSGSHSYKSQLAKGTGLPGYNQKRALSKCLCGVCKRCKDRAKQTRSRAKKAAAKAVAKAVVGTVVEVVDLTED
ncbi:hypothetical protein HYH03_006151 [Edaphochlamys debaryana]|uniref:Uncharacterized protein n=1 Tax=Edaphochlamys debaryana TaxID=47281 RepID=A0A835Y681_9CHLO|nr:hypothetical protein HYH03_006151 [Edaphochlamys debaryana]|eukprot:KAG2495914.1 hypothetical protein HYH03_006151 [Edaphochlamys debaryana]